MSSKGTVKEYLDYATFHGVGRTKNAPYLWLKLFWVLALCASFGMIIWSIHDLFKKYKSFPISTSVEVKTEVSLQFPRVVVCSTNPALYSQTNSDLDDIISKASTEYSIDLKIFNATDMYGYNYTVFDDTNKDKPISNDILFKTAEQFKMHMSVLDSNTLINMSQKPDEFILLCNFAGEECSDGAVTVLRTYDYGLCYEFNPNDQLAIKPYGDVSAVGPRYSLEMLLHIDQHDSIPFVTSSTGAVIGIQFEDSYFHPEQSVFVPTGFETNIALSQVRKDRVPGKKEQKRCQAGHTETLLDCQRKCVLRDILDECDCYRFFFDIGEINGSLPLNETFDYENGWRPCYTEADYKCIQDRLTAYITNPPEQCDTCLAPCIEIVYERDISMVSWPDENYLPILRRIMQSKVKNVNLEGLNRDFVRGNLALVRIYLSSLSYQLIKEEYTYSEVDFISDIGGQLGLWVGCSVLSVLEVAELIVLIVASVRGKKTSPDNQITELPDKEGS